MADTRLPDTSAAKAPDILAEAAATLRGLLPPGFAPQALITLGSGLNGLAAAVENPTVVPYAAVPGMGRSTAPGHEGRFVAGMLEGAPALCMQGRLHPYEGYAPSTVVFPVRLARRLGASTFVATNAAGGVNTGYRPGQAVAIADHINLTGRNPLVGPNDDAVGERFPDMSHAYSPRLRDLAQAAAQNRGYVLEEGVYLGVTGPSFETPAEIRAFRTLGADLVGMSTVWEVIAAVHCGMEVLGLSLVTNMAAGMLDEPITSEDVNRAAGQGAADLEAVVRGVLARL